MFYLLGRLGEIKCDNGPSFRTEFKNWAKDRDIIVNNLAPNKPTSNGLAERVVGIVKHMLLKHHLNFEAFMHALMKFRTTPRKDSYSPSQVFYGRRMKTDAPIAASTLRMRTDLSAAESARQRVSDSKRNSASKQSTTRPDMILGQMVSVQNPTIKRWDKRGIIIEARDPRNRTFQIMIGGTVWTRSKLFLHSVHHIPLTDLSLKSKVGPSGSLFDLANFPPLTAPLPAPRRSAHVQHRKERETGTVNAVFTAPPPPPEEEKKEPPPPAREEKKKQPGLPRCVAIIMPTCQIRQVQALAALMGHRYNGQFIFFRQKSNSNKSMIVTIPSLIAAGIATAVVTGGITGTAVYLTLGDVDVITGDQFKTEGGLHILKLGHPEPWLIAMICITILHGMGTCGACCHKRGKRYVTDKEAKIRDRALGRAKELVHMGAQGADKLLQDVQTYHDMHHEIVTQKMHQITLPHNGGSSGRSRARTRNAQSAPNQGTWQSDTAAAARKQQCSKRCQLTDQRQQPPTNQQQTAKANRHSNAVAAKNCHIPLSTRRGPEVGSDQEPHASYGQAAGVGQRMQRHDPGQADQSA
jgi:hypothetical protein